MTEFVVWNKDYDLGIGVIDSQHKKLATILNKLFEDMKDGKATEHIGETINGLLEYTEVHFSTEEKLFDSTAYPLSTEHKKEHQEFVKKVTEFKEKFDKGNMLLSVSVMNFLKEWLLNHIAVSDKKYEEHLKSHGVQ
ncbi:bacteriohemerythrin [Spirochaeta cellobiosiphila]|uniref:bacteriohemerythrin n=1 Tax=Spirochaeta cellobiosiphila TaxID=504483 RepID=UPI0003F56937|nr:bacteriohemerythrin [Spirochaeta cellobiosiphila]